MGACQRVLRSRLDLLRGRRGGATFDNQSDPSNEVEFQFVSGSRPLGVEPPEAVADLTASVVYTPAPVSAWAIASSGFANDSWSHVNATDGNLSTAWSTPPRSSMQQESITVDTGNIRTLSRVRLRSRLETAALYPEDFQIQVSGNNVNYVTVLTRTGFTATAATWYDFDLPQPTSGRYVRLLVTKSRLYSNEMFYVQLAELAVEGAVQQNDGPELRWTAPHEDGAYGGGVEAYDLCYSTQPITEANFDQASSVTGTPEPAAPGTQQTVIATGLDPGTYYFALRSRDVSGNLSAISYAPPVTWDPL